MVRVFFLSITALTLSLDAYNQTQLDIQGDPNSNFTVAIIKANYNGAAPVVGLEIRAESDRGTGLLSYGDTGVEGRGLVGVRGITDVSGGIGVVGSSDFSTGVSGHSRSGRGVSGSSISTGVGVYGSSSFGTGAVFNGGGGIGIEIRGVASQWGGDSDDCVIATDTSDMGSDMILVSNDVVAIHLDDDDNSPSTFFINNGADNTILSLDESGNLTITGVYSPSSDVNRKENFLAVSPQEILEKVASLPITEWEFKGENNRHIGPMAQDFYAAFGLGQGETTIATVDADGVALAAIQALKKENDSLKGVVANLIERLEKLEQK